MSDPWSEFAPAPAADPWAEFAAPRVGMGDVQASPSAQLPEQPGLARRILGGVWNAVKPGQYPRIPDADPQQAGETTKQAALRGAHEGFGFLKSPEGIAQSVQMLGYTMPGAAGAAKPNETLGGWAESAAVRSANADRTATRRAFKGSDEARHSLGRFMLDTDMPLRSPQKIRDAAQEMQQVSGPMIGGLAQKADATGVTVSLKTALADALNDPRIAGLNKNVMTRGALGGHAGAGHSMGPPGIKDAFADWLTQHGDDVAPSTAHDIRMQLDNLANWDQAAPKQVQKAWRAARDIVDSHLDDAMGKAGFGDQWAEANGVFSNARKLANPNKRGLADIGAERREGNRLGSPSEKASAIAGGLAAAMHNPIAAVGVPAATIALNRYSMPVAARSLDFASKQLVPSLPSKGARAAALAEALKRRVALEPVPAGADE